MNEKLTEEQKQILKGCLWDYRITPQEFYDVLSGQSTPKWPTKAWCVARLINYVNWYNIVKIFKPEEVCALWTPEARRLVRGKYLIEGMDFACRFL